MLRFSLLLVVFVDFFGQGLILPIISTLLIDPSSDFLGAETINGTRQVLFGVLVATFNIFWFFGATYMSKLSDDIGRKKGIMICLLGALAGYILTIIAIKTSDYSLLLLARAISGFTAGNLPIAQAALVDISKSDEERTRNMSSVVVALSLGLIAGPLMAGILSDSAVFGQYASLELPFICATVLVLAAFVSVQMCYDDVHKKRRKIDFGLSAVFLNLWRIRKRPTIVKLAIVFFLFELGINSFYVYLDDYTIDRFQFDTLQNSILMAVFGLVVAFSSGVLMGPLSTRFRKIPTVATAIAVMAVSLTVFMLNPNPQLTYVLIIPIVVAFAVGYPTMLALFSASVGEDEQGWIMGITISLFALGTGMISLAGGAMMAMDPRLPFVAGIASLVLALVFFAALWRQPDVRALDNSGRFTASR